MNQEKSPGRVTVRLTEYQGNIVDTALAFAFAVGSTVPADELPTISEDNRTLTLSPIQAVNDQLIEQVVQSARRLIEAEPRAEYTCIRIVGRMVLAACQAGQ